MKKWFWGLFFLLAALALVINEFGYFGGINVLSLVLGIFLTAIIIISVPKLNFAGILFPLAIILILFKGTLGITISVWTILLIALFLSIGLSIIFQNYRKGHDCCVDENFKTIVNEIDEEVVDVSVNFSSSIKYVNCDNFKKGVFRCSFGAVKIYFDNAKLDKDGAEIVLNISFSGAEIYIPKTWNIINQLNINLGGVEEKNSNMPDKKGPQVILKGEVKLSGVEIIYI